jgi:DNA modification methylase
LTGGAGSPSINHSSINSHHVNEVSNARPSASSPRPSGSTRRRTTAKANRAGRDTPGRTPSYIIWNLLQRYTKENELVVDCFAGSGTTLDVARDLKRRALGYDVHPTRKDIFRVDARKLPPELTGKIDFVFIDPPYSNHLDYGDDPRDIGKLDVAKGPHYYDAMEQVFREILRVLKPGRHMGPVRQRHAT